MLNDASFMRECWRSSCLPSRLQYLDTADSLLRHCRNSVCRRRQPQRQDGAVQCSQAAVLSIRTARAHLQDFCLHSPGSLA